MSADGMMRKNKYRKLLGCFLILTALTLFHTGSAMAAEEVRVFDMAGLFTEEEKAFLSQTIDELRNKMDMDAAIVTTEENPDSAEVYADRFYEEQGLGAGEGFDGALLLIDMENGELCISSEGKMLRYLSDARVETILDDMYEYAVDGDFFGASQAFLTDLEICYDNGIGSGQYNYESETGKVSRHRSITWYEALFALAAAGICGGAAVFGVVREYNMKNDDDRMAANFNLSYRKDSAFRLGNILADVAIGSYITKQVIASQNHRGQGRSSGGGLSSGGRTTTHRSSSGRTHGGGSRKFR